MVPEQAHWWLSDFWLLVFPKYFFWINAIVCIGLMWLLFRKIKQFESKNAALQKIVDQDSVLSFAKQSKDPETVKLIDGLEKKLQQHGISLKESNER